MQVKIKDDLLSRKVLQSNDFAGFVFWYEGIFSNINRKFIFFMPSTNPLLLDTYKNTKEKMDELRQKSEDILSEFIDVGLFNDINRFQLLEDGNFEYISDKSENDYFSKFVNFISIEN